MNKKGHGSQKVCADQLGNVELGTGTEALLQFNTFVIEADRGMDKCRQ